MGKTELDARLLAKSKLIDALVQTLAEETEDFECLLKERIECEKEGLLDADSFMHLIHHIDGIKSLVKNFEEA